MDNDSTIIISFQVRKNASLLALSEFINVLSKLGCTNTEKKFPVFLCRENNKKSEESVQRTAER